MFVGALKGVGYALGVIILLALWLVPDPIGKIVTLWRFVRGERLDDE